MGECISRGFLSSVAVTQPQWHHYRDEARRFAITYEAMRGPEDGAITTG